MNTTLKSKLNVKVPSLLFVIICLILGGIGVAALHLTKDLDGINDDEVWKANHPFHYTS